MIDLHFVRTSNGQKMAIMLEEVGLDYNIIYYDIFAGDHLKPDFKRINPNQRLPALVDHSPVGGEGPLIIAETGAMLLYLAEKSGQLLPVEMHARWTAIQWLTWQISGLGPMLGQAYHFARYAPEGEQYGVGRYTSEARRLLSVLDARLAQTVYLAGDYSVADIACWPWVQNVANLNIDRASYPHIQEWFEKIADRPAVRRVLESADTAVPAGYTKRRMTLSPTEWSNLFGRVNCD